ncbi:MAG: hypothetical protein H5T66_07155, partial [Chloroflexi bacterium]|nr:hypothetical protein [Chloroflexota bacterium]
GWLAHPQPAPPALVAQAEQEAYAAAQQRVLQARAEAERIERAALERQVVAARRRLLRELARTLRCYDQDLNRALRQRVKAEGADLSGLYHRALRLLDGYPDWPREVVEDANTFFKGLNQGERTARLAGNEVSAALDDPRWKAQDALKACK